MNESERQRYKERLLRMRSRIREEVEHILERIPEDVSPPGEHEQSKPPTDEITAALALEHAMEAIRVATTSALDRIENGTFGCCQDCGAAISKARLEAIPYTPYCVNCERKRETSSSEQ